MDNDIPMKRSASATVRDLFGAYCSLIVSEKEWSY